MPRAFGTFGAVAQNYSPDFAVVNRKLLSIFPLWLVQWRGLHIVAVDAGHSIQGIHPFRSCALPSPFPVSVFNSIMRQTSLRTMTQIGITLALDRTAVVYVMERLASQPTRAIGRVPTPETPFHARHHRSNRLNVFCCSLPFVRKLRYSLVGYLCH